MRNKYFKPILDILIFDDEEDILTTSSAASSDEFHAKQKESVASADVDISISNIISLGK